jgi:hypothetical protein
MHRKYASRGLAAVSVSLDNPKDPKDHDKVVRFLKDQQAAFLNLQLNATPEEWQERLKINGPPCVYVFNRGNQYVLKQEDEEDFAAIEKKVLELLAK